MYATMDCCKCKSDEGKLEFHWASVDGYDDWQGELSLADKADRASLLWEVKRITLSVAGQIAKKCSKTMKSSKPEESN